MSKPDEPSTTDTKEIESLILPSQDSRLTIDTAYIYTGSLLLLLQLIALVSSQIVFETGNLSHYILRVYNSFS